MFNLEVGQACIVRWGDTAIVTSIKEISTANFFFTVQPHINFPSLVNLRFTLNKIPLGTKPINYVRHYAYTKTGAFNSACWVEI